MTLRYMFRGAAVGFVGVLTIGSASAQVRDGGLLPPDQSGMVTVAGCLLRGDQIRGGDEDKYVLAIPRISQMTSAPTQTCSADAGADAVQLDNPDKGNVADTMLGRWVEISGRLERETSGDDILRELDVMSARLLPVDAPRAEAEPAPEPAAVQAAAPDPEPAPPAAEPSPAPVPVATSGQATTELPATASFGPLSGLIGLFAVAGSFALRSFRSRQRG